MNKLTTFLFLFSITLCHIGCYSFRGVSIPPDVNTYYVNQFQLGGNRQAPPDTPEKFTEQLRLKIRNQSNLKETEMEPDIEFAGTIKNMVISNEAVSQGSQAGQVSLNKLTLTVEIEYISNRNEEDNWKKTFSFGIPFEPDVNILDVQDDFIDEIFEEISEQVFNEAFTDW